MSLKSRAQQLKADIPALFLALNSPDTPALARILAALTIRLIPRPVMDACCRQAAGLWQNGKPKRWYYALPSVVIWVLIAWVILKQCFKKRRERMG